MQNTTSVYDLALDPNPANYVPLTPLTFLSRTAGIYPDRTAIIDGDVRYTWSATYARCVRLAAALRAAGVGVGDTVAVLAPNTPVLFESHFGVPMAGAVLNALNIRLDAESIAFMLEHGGAKVLITDLEFADVVQRVMQRLDHPPRLITVGDVGQQEDPLGSEDYEAFLAEGNPDFAWQGPDNEWRALALNYTSGTTGNPKGVVYHHRGAYLNAVSNALSWNMPLHPVYLWTLPMFHCNGWCFPWTITALAGTHVCLRAVTAESIFSAIAEHRVTHLCGAPVVLNMLLNAAESTRQRCAHTVHVATGGAAPPEAVIEGVESLGMKIAHLYGLTETYGPATLCAWHTDW
ncbi:MAG: AMP-binding protein, partial [Gammaproteobacteria bacterium]|nr:AMP-binding protein [Gammaproteobacteria bacterium]